MSNGSSIVVVKPSSNLPLVIDNNGLVAYFERIKSFPVLSEEEEVALINDADTYETAYVKMRNALITYQTLSDEEKSAVSAEYQLLTDRINSYNNIISEANTEHSKATELAFAPLAAMSFTFMAALWYLLKKKIFA